MEFPNPTDLGLASDLFRFQHEPKYLPKHIFLSRPILGHAGHGSKCNVRNVFWTSKLYFLRSYIWDLPTVFVLLSQEARSQALTEARNMRSCNLDKCPSPSLLVDQRHHSWSAWKPARFLVCLWTSAVVRNPIFITKLTQIYFIIL